MCRTNCSNFMLLIRREQYRITPNPNPNTIIFSPSNYQILNLLHCHSQLLALMLKIPY